MQPSDGNMVYDYEKHLDRLVAQSSEESSEVRLPAWSVVEGEANEPVQMARSRSTSPSGILEYSSSSLADRMSADGSWQDSNGGDGAENMVQIAATDAAASENGLGELSPARNRKKSVRWHDEEGPPISHIWEVEARTIGSEGRYLISQLRLTGMREFLVAYRYPLSVIVAFGVFVLLFLLVCVVVLTS